MVVEVIVQGREWRVDDWKPAGRGQSEGEREYENRIFFFAKNEIMRSIDEFQVLRAYGHSRREKLFLATSFFVTEQDRATDQRCLH